MSNQDYHVRFTYDLGRGIGEEFKYYPGRKLLQIEWKGVDGGGETLNITADSTEETQRHLWNLTAPHREYFDADFSGNTPAAEDAPVGVHDGKIYVPPDIQQSVGVEETGEQKHEQQDTQQEQGQGFDHAHPPHSLNGNGMLPVNELGVQVMAVPINEWQEMLTRDKLKDCVIATMKSICMSKLEKDSTELAIVNAQMELIDDISEEAHE